MILVTGSSGFLGQRLSSMLMKTGFKLRLLSSNQKFIDSNSLINAEKKLIDYYDGKLIKKYLKNVKTVIHLVSMNYKDSEENPDIARKINVGITENLLNCIMKSDVKNFIYFSTVHIYGEQKGSINEQTKPNPISIYAKTHLESEDFIRKVCADKNINVSIIRLSNAFGAPFEKKSSSWDLLINSLAKEVVKDQTITINSNVTIKRDFIPLNYFFNGLQRIILQPNDKFNINTINACTGRSKNLLEVANIISMRSKKVLGYTPKIIIRDQSNLKYTLQISNKSFSNYATYGEEYFNDEIDNLLLMISKWYKKNDHFSYE